MNNEVFSTEFQGFFAEFFDILHDGCNDALIYPQILKAYGNRILELGCGTGRIAVPLAQAGYKVTGIEYEADMIALACKKDYPKENLTILQGDARNFSLNQTFDAILLSCNFINHFIDSNDVLSILQCCKSHLANEGVIIIDCSVPDYAYMQQSNGKTEVFDFHMEHGTVIKDTFTPSYDFVRQIETDIIVLEEYKDAQLLRRAEVKEQLTWYCMREIFTLIREAGLSLAKQTTVLDGDSFDIANASNMIFFASHIK